MKQEVYKPSSLVLGRLVSALLHPLWFLFTRGKHHPEIDPQSIKRILISEFGCIGDLILINPALEILRSEFPSAEIDVIVNQPASELVSLIPAITGVHTYTAPWNQNRTSMKLWIHTLSLIRKLRERRYDLAIDFNGDLRNILLLYLVKPKYRSGYTATGGKYLLTHPEEFPFHKHQVLRAVDLVSRLANREIDDIPAPRLNTNRLVDTVPDIRNAIVLHPGANHAERRWSADRWNALIGILGKKYELVLIESPECESINKIKTNYPELNYFSGSLLDMAAFLPRQKLLIGMDSMSVHLATALGIPALALFGIQNPELTAPFGENGYVLQPSEACTHKRKNWRLCGQCLNMIIPEDVVEKIDLILN